MKKFVTLYKEQHADFASKSQTYIKALSDINKAISDHAEKQVSKMTEIVYANNDQAAALEKINTAISDHTAAQVYKMTEIVNANNDQAAALEKINQSINSFGPSPIKQKLSDRARYLIWWLTQIEVDVCDKTDATWQTYIKKIQVRAGVNGKDPQQPTTQCRTYLAEYVDLRNDFEQLLIVPEPNDRHELQTHLDDVIQKIWILKRKIANQVTDIDSSTQKDSTKKSTTQTGAKS